MLWVLGLIRDGVFGLLLLLALSIAAREGFAGLVRRVVLVFKLLPGVEWLISAVLRKQVRDFLRQIEREAGREGEADAKKTMAIPEKGRKVVCSVRTRYNVTGADRGGGAGGSYDVRYTQYAIFGNATGICMQ